MSGINKHWQNLTSMQRCRDATSVSRTGQGKGGYIKQLTVLKSTLSLRFSFVVLDFKVCHGSYLDWVYAVLALAPPNPVWFDNLISLAFDLHWGSGCVKLRYSLSNLSALHISRWLSLCYIEPLEENTMALPSYNMTYTVCQKCLNAFYFGSGVRNRKFKIRVNLFYSGNSKSYLPS